MIIATHESFSSCSFKTVTVERSTGLKISDFPKTRVFEDLIEDFWREKEVLDDIEIDVDGFEWFREQWRKDQSVMLWQAGHEAITEQMLALWEISSNGVW